MRIYLATPYSDPDPKIRQERFDNINRIAASLINDGHYVFSPISHTHPIALIGNLPTGWEFWDGFDRSFIEWCDVVCVFCTAGWDTSVGVQAEIKIANELGKPIKYICNSDTSLI